jgi:hypothetical protein
MGSIYSRRHQQSAGRVVAAGGGSTIFDRVMFSNDPTNTTLNNCVMPASELSAKINTVNTTFLYAVAKVLPMHAGLA